MHWYSTGWRACQPLFRLHCQILTRLGAPPQVQPIRFKASEPDIIKALRVPFIPACKAEKVKIHLSSVSILMNMGYVNLKS